MKQRYVMQWVAGVVLLLVSDAWAARQFNPNEVIVLPDSKVVRAVYVQPVTSDLFALLVARETFRLADDQKAVKALDEYLARVGLLALAGETVAPSGTIERIITDPSALPNVPSNLASRILSSALTPRLAVAVNAEKHLPDPKSSFQTHKQEHPGVWSSWRQERADSVHVFVIIENTGRNRITQFDTRLLIDRESADKPIELQCRPSPGFDSSIAPGETRLHDCFVEVERVAIPDLVKAVRAAQKAPSRWQLLPVRINFADPAVNFSSRGVYYWLDTGRAAEQASIALKKVGCEARGSCSEDFRMRIRFNPQYLLMPGGALAGILLGWLIVRVTRRHAVSGAVVSLLPVGGVVAIIMVILMTTTGMDSLIAVAVGYYGFFALAPFLVALWITIAVVGSLRAKNTME